MAQSAQVRDALAAAKAGDPDAFAPLESLAAVDPCAAPMVLTAIAALLAHRGGGGGGAADLLAQANEAAMALDAPWLAAEAAFDLSRDAWGGVIDVAMMRRAADLFDRHPPPASLAFAAAFAKALRAADIAADQAAQDLALAAFALDPSDRGARRLATALICGRQAYDQADRLLIAADHFVQDDADLAAAALTAMLRSPLEDEAPVRAIILRRAAVMPAVAALNPPPTDPTGRRLRVGVAQACFERSAYYNALIPTLDGLARAGVDLFAYQAGVRMGAPTAPLAPLLVGWRDIGGLDPDAAAALIAADRLDVLLDLEGLSPAAPTEVYRRRPAPVIATSFNTISSQAPGLFDVVIADAATPPPDAQDAYAERIVRLPEGYYYGAFRLQTDAPPPAAPVGPIVIGAACQIWKISPACADAWARILQARPEVWLRLRTPALQNQSVAAAVLDRLAAAGAPLERIELDGAALPYADHLRRFNGFDVLLDSFPFQGPSTLFEALWMGIPTVVRQGRRWATRFGGGLVSAAGFPEWLTEDADAYVRLALDLIDQAPTRRTAAARLAQRAQVAGSALCDAAGFGRELERILREMAEDAWRRRR